MSAQPAPAAWYAEGLRFACTQCGNCCGGGPGYVWVSQAEAIEIAAHLGLTVEQFYQRHTRRVGMRHALLELRNWDCEFLRADDDGRKRCTIYEVRPVQCRTWPFWKSNLDSPQAWADAARGCPGISRGRHHPLPIIQTALHQNGALPL